MKGWIYFFAAAACSIGGYMYFHGLQGIDHSGGTDHTPSQAQSQPIAPAPSTAPISAPTPMLPLATGLCYLTMPVRVANKYGQLTYARGTMLQYIGEEGSRLIVQMGDDRFTVAPEMVANSRDAALAAPTPTLFAASRPALPNAAQMGMAPAYPMPTPILLGADHVQAVPHVRPTAVAITSGSAAAVPDEPVRFGDFSRYLLIAQGADGRGSGCLVKYQGHTLVVTNAHVISGILDAHFQSMDSQEVPTGPFNFAIGADLAVAGQDSYKDGLEVMTDVQKEVNIGDEVVVLGNSLGSGVATEITGKVLGIGPNLVEVDAKFVEGNSGSPIIHVKTGKLIGIATFAEKRTLNSLSKDSQFSTEWRRFGYRLDTVKAWEHTTAERFAAEARTVDAVRKQTMDLYHIGCDLYQGQLDLINYEGQDDRLRQVVNDFLSESSGHASKGPDLSDARMRLERGLIFETHEDIDPLRQRDFTWYHWHKMQDDFEARTFMKKAFERMLAADEEGHQMLP